MFAQNRSLVRFFLFLIAISHLGGSRIVEAQIMGNEIVINKVYLKEDKAKYTHSFRLAPNQTIELQVNSPHGVTDKLRTSVVLSPPELLAIEPRKVNPLAEGLTLYPSTLQLGNDGSLDFNVGGLWKELLGKEVVLEVKTGQATTPPSSRDSKSEISVQPSPPGEQNKASASKRVRGWVIGVSKDIASSDSAVIKLLVSDEEVVTSDDGEALISGAIAVFSKDSVVAIWPPSDVNEDLQGVLRHLRSRSNINRKAIRITQVAGEVASQEFGNATYETEVLTPWSIEHFGRSDSSFDVSDRIDFVVQSYIQLTNDTPYRWSDATVEVKRSGELPFLVHVDTLAPGEMGRFLIPKQCGFLKATASLKLSIDLKALSNKTQLPVLWEIELVNETSEPLPAGKLSLYEENSDVPIAVAEVMALKGKSGKGTINSNKVSKSTHVIAEFPKGKQDKVLSTKTIEKGLVHYTIKSELEILFKAEPECVFNQLIANLGCPIPVINLETGSSRVGNLILEFEREDGEITVDRNPPRSKQLALIEEGTEIAKEQLSNLSDSKLSSLLSGTCCDDGFSEFYKALIASRKLVSDLNNEQMKIRGELDRVRSRRKSYASQTQTANHRPIDRMWSDQVQQLEAKFLDNADQLARALMELELLSHSTAEEAIDSLQPKSSDASIPPDMIYMSGD